MKTDGKYRFGVCYDGSSNSKRALDQVLKMMCPDDNLVLITVKEAQVKLDTVDSISKSICDEAGISHQKHIILDKPVGSSVWGVIKSYLIEEATADNYVDFIACGNVGANHAAK
jgi:hypothetical protein